MIYHVVVKLAPIYLTRLIFLIVVCMCVWFNLEDKVGLNKQTVHGFFWRTKAVWCVRSGVINEEVITDCFVYGHVFC